MYPLVADITSSYGLMTDTSRLRSVGEEIRSLEWKVTFGVLVHRNFPISWTFELQFRLAEPLWLVAL